MKARTTTLITCLALAACSSPEPESIEPPMARVAAPPPAPLRAEPASGLLVPVDHWRRELAVLLPVPWRFETLEAQVVAPAGWTRIAGDRGLALWLTDGQQRQVFWVMPHGFDGRVVDPTVAARLSAENQEFVVYEPRSLATGWRSTDEVLTALGLGGSDGELERVRQVARADMDSFGKAIDAFKGDMGYYPVRLNDLWARPADGEGRWKGPYLNEPNPQDPWGSEYAYSAGSDSYQLISYGADGAPGGENADQDLTSTVSLQK